MFLYVFLTITLRFIFFTYFHLDIGGEAILLVPNGERLIRGLYFEFSPHLIYPGVGATKKKHGI